MKEKNISEDRQIERIKEEIKYRTELIKLVSIFLLTVIGGEISLFLKGLDLKRAILFIFGIPIAILLGWWLWLNHKRINKLLKLLEGKDVWINKLSWHFYPIRFNLLLFVESNKIWKGTKLVFKFTEQLLVEISLLFAGIVIALTVLKAVRDIND